MRGARFLLVFALVAGVVAVDAAPSGAAVTLVARGSLGQVQVWGATPGETLELLDATDTVVTTGVADDQGAFIFGVAPEQSDDIAAGPGYQVRQGVDLSNEVAVFDFDYDAPVHPAQSFYDDQDLPAPAYENKVTLTAADDDGYGYVTTRDGTQLSINVMAPYDPLGNVDPPYPTLIDYSGYTPANPGDNAPEILLARAAGFAVVGVNIRGTGCSGGAYSYFEPLQALDGYDVIEAVAAQPWVRHGATGVNGFDSGPDVGMVGISFPGISQLFVARTNPPSLAAISPLSVLADSYRSTLYPGGIQNDGFATGWVTDRENQAKPSGQAWAANRISGAATGDPDEVCEENQRLKLQAPPLVARFTQGLLFEPDPGEQLAPEQWVDEIEVPTFIAGAFQDEQTGGRWSTMLDDFDPAVLKRAILFNGTHADALGPDVLRDLLEFLDLYVARRGPQLKAILRLGGPEQLGGTFGEPYALAPYHGNANVGIPAAAYATQTAYEAQDPVRIYWERGGPGQPECFVDTGGSIATEVREACDEDEARGAPFARFETTADTWPLPGTTADELFLQPDGGLADAAPTVPDGEPRAWSSWTYDNSRDQVGTFSGSTEDIWHKDAEYTWDQPSEPTSLRYVSAPFDAVHAYAGSGSVDLWLRSTAIDVDVEVTLTEVQSDGRETYIQSGWLRASHRQEAPGSTAPAPYHTHLVEEPVPADTFVPLRVELFPFTEVVRPGSRLALTIAAPGGNRPFWHFNSLGAPPDTVNDIGHSVGRPSHLTLPEVTSTFTLPVAAAAVTDCGDLRAEPCREVDPSTRPTAVGGAIDPGDTGADLDRGIDLTWTAPAAPGVTSYDAEELPSGRDLAVGDATAGLRVPVAIGEPPPAGDPSYRVTATFGLDDGQPSDASAGVVPEHPFTDVGRNAWNVDAVDWVSAWRVAEGFPDGTFRNGANVTRGQFVSWLWTMFGRPSGSPPHGFSDVRGALVSDAVAWAKAQDIVTVPGDRFRPRAFINRAQVAFWLWVASGRPEGAPPNGFADVPVDAWYAPAVDWAKDAGVVAGFPGNQFRPVANATRGQAASWFDATAAAYQPAP